MCDTKCPLFSSIVVITCNEGETDREIKRNITVMCVIKCLSFSSIVVKTCTEIYAIVKGKRTFCYVMYFKAQEFFLLNMMVFKSIVCI